MFSNDGFLNEKPPTSNKSQTHVFTSFPNSAVDPDDEISESTTANNNAMTSGNDRLYGFNASDPDRFSLPPPATANENKQDQLRAWQFEYYQRYFQVDTNQVIGRLIGSFTPRPNKSYFDSNIRQNPDLYGPFWVCTTFILTIAISGNIVNYFRLSQEDFQIDFSKITLSSILVFLYWWLMPTFVYFFFRWRLNRIEYTFLELLCIYGYSLTIFIPVSVLWMIQIRWLQWLLTILASLVSGSVLVVTFWPLANLDQKRLNSVSILIIFLAHLCMAISIMLVFFYVSDPKLIPTDITTKLTTLTTTLVTTITTTTKKP